MKEKIAVEIKSFIGASFMKDLHLAVGQFSNYRILLKLKEEDRVLYLAVPRSVYIRRFAVAGVKFICQQLKLRLLVFDQVDETIVVWEK